MSFKSAFESRDTAGSSEFQVRGLAVLNDRLAHMMSVEMACTAVGRTTIECCVRWCATRCIGSDTADMMSAESWTSARPPSLVYLVWSSELTSDRRSRRLYMILDRRVVPDSLFESSQTLTRVSVKCNFCCRSNNDRTRKVFRSRRNISTISS